MPVMRKINQYLFAAVATCAVTMALVVPRNAAIAQDRDAEEDGLSKDTSGKTQNRHSRVPNTKRLESEQAETLYKKIKRNLQVRIVVPATRLHATIQNGGEQIPRLTRRSATVGDF